MLESKILGVIANWTCSGITGFSTGSLCTLGGLADTIQ